MFSLRVINRIEGQTETVHLIWIFSNFTNTLENQKIRELRTLRDKDMNFQLKMLLLGKNSDLIEIYYRTQTSIFLKSELAVRQSNQSDRTVRKSQYKIIPANKWQYLASFFNRDMNKENLFFDGSFHLHFTFTTTNNVEVNCQSVPAPQLSEDFNKLLTDGCYSDAVLKSAEGEEFRVHKPILSIRSEVFKAHFEHKTMESVTNTINTHLETEVLHEILTYIYTDKAPRVGEIPVKLLAAADFYQLGRLKTLCEESLEKRLTVENAIETLGIANLYSANRLTQSILEFIKDGQAQLITKTPDWKKIQDVEIVKKIYEFIMAADGETDTNYYSTDLS